MIKEKPEYLQPIRKGFYFLVIVIITEQSLYARQ